MKTQTVLGLDVARVRAATVELAQELERAADGELLYRPTPHGATPDVIPYMAWGGAAAECNGATRLGWWRTCPAAPGGKVGLLRYELPAIGDHVRVGGSYYRISRIDYHSAGLGRIATWGEPVLAPPAALVRAMGALESRVSVPPPEGFRGDGRAEAQTE